MPRWWRWRGPTALDATSTNRCGVRRCRSAKPSGLTGYTTVQEWVNGGLMSVFFLVVGLEIAHERRDGDLADIRTAIVPLVGAVGGMAGAGLVYVLIVHQGPGAAGWGIPMATDIAFALGALALLGQRFPPGLRLMLLTLAVADDIGSVLVLAIFYSSRTHWPSLLGAAAVVAGMVAYRRRGRPSAWPYLVAGVALWVLLATGGVEPALAGVVVGVLIPGAAFSLGPDAGRHVENAIAPISAYVVLPLFAVANAGVVIDSSILHHPGATGVFVGIVAARVLGKLGGITLACLAVVGLGWARPLGGAVGPRGRRRRHRRHRIHRRGGSMLRSGPGWQLRAPRTRWIPGKGAADGRRHRDSGGSWPEGRPRWPEGRALTTANQRVSSPKVMRHRSRLQPTAIRPRLGSRGEGSMVEHAFSQGHADSPVAHTRRRIGVHVIHRRRSRLDPAAWPT